MTGASGGPRAASRRRARRSLAAGVAGAALLAAPGLAAGPETGEGSGFLGRLFDRVGRVWVVDAPGAAGARFSLGASTFFEHQESLRFTAQQTTVTTVGPAGEPVITTVVADPELLERKFDITWELVGAGVEVPVALPALGGAVYPTLVLQAGGADLDLEFGDRSAPADSVTLGGQAALFGAGVDVAAPLCAGCPWLAFAGFRYQWLPETEVDRGFPIGLPSPPGDPGQGQSVLVPLLDETRLRREAREVSGRLAYGLPGARVLPFAGVRHRWTEVTIDGELAFQDALGPGEARLDTRTRLEAETTLALAGFDFQLGPRLFGSFETAASEDDYGAALRVVALLQGPPRRLGLASRPTTDRDRPPRNDRALKIAAALAPRLAEIEVAFLAGRAALTLTVSQDGEPSYLLAEVEALLAKTEADLLAVLGEYPELEALGDWVRDQFAATRNLLARASSPPQQAADGARRFPTEARSAPLIASSIVVRAPFRQIPDLALAALPSLPMQLAQGPSGPTVPQAGAAVALDLAHDAVALPLQRMENDRLMTWLAFTTTLDPGTTMFVFPRYKRSKRVGMPRNASGEPLPEGIWFPAGSYSYELPPGPRKLDCDARNPSTGSCPLDLVRNPPQILCCNEDECRPGRCL